MHASLEFLVLKSSSIAIDLAKSDNGSHFKNVTRYASDDFPTPAINILSVMGTLYLKAYSRGP